MQAFNARPFPPVLLVILLVLAPVASAQNNVDAGYKAEREKAFGLFSQEKYLEALPLFEDLAAKNFGDDKVLLGLAACLVDHSATLSDPEAGGKERMRAAGLLKKAQSLGNNSPLLQNLLQVLQAAPEGGQIKYSDNPAANDAMRTAESAFARREYDEAIKYYSHALELDPKNTSAALFVGDTYFAKKDFANAGIWYDRASQINPNSETPYRYYSDMLTKNGDMEGARRKAIQAVVAEPYNPITWRGLAQWANASHVQLIRVHINVPNTVTVKNSGKVTINVPQDPENASSAAWLAYSMAQALWRGDKFKKEFPQEAQYRHSLAEEADALKTAAKVWSELRDKRASSQTTDPDFDLLLRLYRGDMIESYVLLSSPDEGIAKDYADYRETHRALLEQYLGQFIVPPLPAKR